MRNRGMVPEYSRNDRGKVTDYNDKNKQIRAKNLFGDDASAEKSNQKVVTEKNVQSIRSNVLSSGENYRADAARQKKSVVAKGKKVEKKSPRQKQESYRFYVCAVMAAFVVFVMGWGICQLVRAINTAEEQKMMMAEPGEQVVDNSANAGKTIDVDKLVNTVLDNVDFEAELNLLDDSVASGMIATTEGTDLQVYMGNGTYSDELVVMTALSETDAKENQKNAETHLAEMQKQFNDYLPKEAKKIDGAIKVRCGCYVVVCVTNDTETAKKNIDAFMTK